MLAKLESGYRITLPSPIAKVLGVVKYFDARMENGLVILTPLRRAEGVRAKLTELEVVERDVGAAVRWARRPKRGRKK